MLKTQQINMTKKYKKLHKQLMDQYKTEPTLLDLDVIANPNLAKQEPYQILRHKIKLYNNKVETNPKMMDPYEVQSFNSLFSVLTEISMMQNNSIKLKQLKNTKDWFLQQQKVIKSRNEQNKIKYKPLRKRPNLNHSIQKNENSKNLLQSDILYQTLLPYQLKYRTIHSDIDLPIDKLKQYKGKHLNIQPPIQLKKIEKTNRVTYPKPIKFEKIKQQKQEQKIQQTKQNQPNQPIPPIEQNIPQQKPQIQQKQDQLGGLGQQPPEPGDQEDPQENQEKTIQDKLAPKNKIYIKPMPIQSIRVQKDVEVRDHYMHNIGDQGISERIISQKYTKLQNLELANKKQDEQKIQIINKWARSKSKFTKQLQKRLQQMHSTLDYKIIPEQKFIPTSLKENQQRQYGLTQKKTKKNYKKSFDYSTIQLPRIKQNRRKQLEGYERTIDDNKINRLKKRFSHMLNITTEIEQRQLPKSLGQYSSRFKAFSEVLIQNSAQKQRLNQLQQVQSIKQRLTKNKVGVNVTTLANGLCLPQYHLQEDDTQMKLPLNDLPSNPFMIQKKKKKKK